jgi:hypothetical protein
MAKRNSLHASLWRFTYSEILPDNLCPYVWKLVPAVILFLPLLILRIFRWLGFNLDFTHSQYNKYATVGRKQIEGLATICMTGIVLFYGWITFNAVKFLINFTYQKDAAMIGLLLNAVIVIILLILFIIYLKEKREDYISEKEWKAQENGQEWKPRTRIIADFISAWYHRNCPKINWE